MGTPWSDDGRCAGKMVVGLAGAPLLSGRDDQQDIMMVDPDSWVPINNACTTGGDQENRMEDANCGAPAETLAGCLPATSLSSGMFTNFVDGRFKSDKFSDFVSFLQRYPAAEEYRNFTLVAVVRFLEGQNAEVIKATPQHIAEMESEVTKLNDQLIHCSSYKTQELCRDLEKVSEELSGAQAQLESMSNNIDLAQLGREEAVQTLQAQLDEETRQNEELRKGREIFHKDLNAQRMAFDSKFQHSQELGRAKDQKVHQLTAIIEEKKKDFSNMEGVTSRLTSECQKLKAQLAAIEKKSAQESLTSGSYADGHGNPSMLEAACKAVDKATDWMVRYLHENSVTSKGSLKRAELEGFIGKISPVRLTDFSRPAQVKHVWGHWICSKMFQGFEHVFFDMSGDRSSPLNFKKHALECFQSFQQYKGVAPLDYYKACAMFREFCTKTYPLLFPLKLVNEGLQLVPSMSCDHAGRFDGDGELYLRFLDVAKAIWLLHELSMSFDPPASILRMCRGAPFDKQYHEPVIKDAENDETALQVMLMIRPAFRVRNTTVKSRVIMSKKSA